MRDRIISGLNILPAVIQCSAEYALNMKKKYNKNILYVSAELHILIDFIQQYNALNHFTWVSN